MSQTLNEFNELVSKAADWADANESFGAALKTKLAEVFSYAAAVEVDRDKYKRLYERATSATFEDLTIENTRLQQSLATEKERRVHWQGLAYDGMLLLDRFLGRSSTSGLTNEETFREDADKAGRKWQQERLRLASAGLQIEALDYLRASEGDAVTLYCDNPEFDGPGAKVACSGEWTGWTEREFTGDTSAAAIFAAADAKRQLPPEQYPDVSKYQVSETIEPFRFGDHIFGTRDILWCVLANARRAAQDKDRCMWAEVAERTGLGSTSSHKLCLAFGFHPDTGEEQPKSEQPAVTNDQTQQDDGAAN